MGSTPIHGIPFADPTDLVRDWPALSEDVALAIEAALEDISVAQKRIEAFTGDGTWTVPAGVTYAIAHIKGGGGGSGRGGSGDGSVSSVAFTSGTVTAAGGIGSDADSIFSGRTTSRAGAANSGDGAVFSGRASDGTLNGVASSILGGQGAMIVFGAEVTPGASIAVVVGNGGAAGTNGAAGGSGYVYIEFFEGV